MNRKIVLLTLLLNAVPLHSEGTMTQITDQVRTLFTNSYNNIKDTLSESPYYEFASTVVAASCVMLVGYYISKKNLENPKNRFKFLSNQEFALLAQQLLPTIDARLESIASLVVLYNAAQNSDCQEELEDQLSIQLNSDETIKTTILCNDLIEEVKVRMRKLENNNQDYSTLKRLKAQLTEYNKIIKQVKKILGLYEVNNNHNSNHDCYSNFNPHHNHWHYDSYNAWKSTQNKEHQESSSNNSHAINTENQNKHNTPNPVLIDIIKDINVHDILLSSNS